MIQPQIEGTEPFRLPSLPLSLVDWSQRLIDIYWDRHQRCMAVLLLLDVATRQWTARVPKQQCGPDAAAWLADGHGLTDLKPTHVLAGTAQLCVLRDTAELVQAVPEVDGLHWIWRMMPDHKRVHLFTRIHGRPQLSRGDGLVHDDWEATVDMLKAAGVLT